MPEINEEGYQDNIACFEDVVDFVRGIDESAAYWLLDNYPKFIGTNVTDVASMFTWSESPQGGDFWSNIDIRVDDIIYGYNN